MNFYKLLIGSRSCVDYATGNAWAGIVCSKEPGHTRAGIRTTPLTLDLTRLKVVDFSSTTLADMVIGERVKAVLRGAGLTGFTTNPVVMKGAKYKKLSGTSTFWEFLATRNGGYAHKASGIILRFECEACGLKRFSSFEHGIQIDEGQWDGSDFFTLRDCAGVFCSEKCRSVVLEQNLTNVDFVLTTDMEWPKGIIRF
jgi:hypothetical protein